MHPYQLILDAICADPRYRRNLDWGEPRPGHPEGTVRAHIDEVERNVEHLRPKLNDDEYWKLRVLVHTHDTFKRDAEPGVPIADPRSHASLARAFLAEFCDDGQLLAIVQYHDEPYALWRQHRLNDERLQKLFDAVEDWNLFLAFCIADGCTAGKSREPLRWWFRTVAGRVESRFTETDLV